MEENYKRPKCSCSKEPVDYIPTDRIIGKLDSLFARNDMSGAGRLLEYWENEARALGDNKGLIEILNEEIGYYRRTKDKDRALNSVYEAFDLIKEMYEEENISAGTVFLNGATTLKAFGRLDESLPYYEKAGKIFEDLLSEDDYRMAAYYNNAAAAYEEAGKTEKAAGYYIKAIGILQKKGDSHADAAVSFVNLAHLYYRSDPTDGKIYECMDKAYDAIVSEAAVRDGELAFTISKCIDAFEFFGYFALEKELRLIMENIYEGT